MAPPANHTYAAVATAMSAWDSKPYVCMRFETLTQLVHLPEKAFVCNPTSKAVRRIHVCSRRYTEKGRKERIGPPKEKPQRGASLASLQRQRVSALRQRQAALAGLSRARARQRDTEKVNNSN